MNARVLNPMILQVAACGLLGMSISACSSETKAAEEQVRQRLTDPGSAQFKNVKVKSDYVCGEVNAKNKMGGYNGFRRFYVDDRDGSGAVVDPQVWASAEVIDAFGKDILTPSIDTTAFEAVYNRVCR